MEESPQHSTANASHPMTTSSPNLANTSSTISSASFLNSSQLQLQACQLPLRIDFIAMAQKLGTISKPPLRDNRHRTCRVVWILYLEPGLDVQAFQK